MNYRNYLSKERVINTDHKTRHFRLVFTRLFMQIYVFFKSFQPQPCMVDDLHVIATALQCLAIQVISELGKGLAPVVK